MSPSEQTTSSPEVHKGLEGVVAGDTSISRVDGQHCQLIYRGYHIDELIGPLNTEIAAEKERRAAEHYEVHYEGWRILMGQRRSRTAERLRVTG